MPEMGETDWDSIIEDLLRSLNVPYDVTVGEVVDLCMRYFAGG